MIKHRFYISGDREDYERFAGLMEINMKKSAEKGEVFTEAVYRGAAAAMRAILLHEAIKTEKDFETFFEDLAFGDYYGD